MTHLTRAVFLDRDGTIIEDRNYLTDPAELRLLPRAADALRRLGAAGFGLFVVTNQSAVARGWLTERALREVHAALDELLRARGAYVDAYYYCPHLPGGTVARYAVDCDCRKPKPGLLLRAAAEWHVDLPASYMVGDSARDVLAGRAAGCHPLLVAPHADGAPPDATVVPDLAAAADAILHGPRGAP